MMIRRDLLRGNQVEVLRQWAPRTGVIHAVSPSPRRRFPSVRCRIDFLAPELAARGREAQESFCIATQVRRPG
jgi:DNA-binding transcriptional LysR family regulator